MTLSELRYFIVALMSPLPDRLSTMAECNGALSVIL